MKDGIILTKYQYLVCKYSIFTVLLTVLGFIFVNFFDLCVKQLNSLPTFCYYCQWFLVS